MASAIIHLAVAKTLEKNFNITNIKDYYLGSIAPDISKQINQSKQISHFIDIENTNIPNVKKFINKYPNFINNSFELGYFIHLYTDKIWFSKYLNKIVSGNYIKLLDGTTIKTTEEEILRLIYQDYTNLNIVLLDEYNMDLSLFYEEFSIPKTTINEIPLDKLNILINKMGIIIQNSNEKKAYTFDKYTIQEFIETTSNEILKKLKDYNY